MQPRSRKPIKRKEKKRWGEGAGQYGPFLPCIATRPLSFFHSPAGGTLTYGASRRRQEGAGGSARAIDSRLVLLLAASSEARRIDLQAREVEMKAVQGGNLEREVADLKERLECLISEKEAYLRDLEVANKEKRDLEEEIILCKAEKAKKNSGHGEEGLYEDLSIDEHNQLLERVEQNKRRLAIQNEEMKRLMKELCKARNERQV